MQKIYTFLLLLTLTVTLHAQRINTVEYFYDTDPGVGHASQLTISSGDLDSVINFPVTGLSAGVHILSVRLKNSLNTWSSTYASGVLVSSGVGGTTAFSQAEYFFDTDPGFGHGQQMSVSGSEMDDIVNFSVTGLTSGPHTIYIRLKNTAGQWSTVYSSSFLLAAGTGGATTFTQAEYYFDHDPGFGNGQQLAISGASIDSLVNFNVSGLTTGAHTIYIRLKNSVNQWSYAYQGTFLLSGGTAGVPMVKTLENFIGADSGISRNAIIPLTATASLDTTVSVFIPDNGSDSAILGLRLANQTGQVGNVALARVNLCDLYRPTASFRTAQYGTTFSLISTTTYNPSNKVHWYVDDVLYDSSYTINYTFPAGTVGTKRIKLIAGTGCRLDTVVKEISMPGVEMVQPESGQYGNDFGITIYGGGLDTSMQIYLQHGDTIVYPYMKYKTDASSMVAVFDFHDFHLELRGGQGAGYDWRYDAYQVHVPFPNGYEPPRLQIRMLASRPTTMCDGIAQVVGCPVATGPEEPYFTTSITGSGGIRTGYWSNQFLSLTNTSNQVVKGVPFYLMVPSWFDVDTSYWNIVGGSAEIRKAYSIMVPVDTVINGVHLTFKLFPLICPIMMPNETVTYPFRVRTTVASERNTVYTWADKRMFGSPFKWFWPPCVEEVVNNILGFVPVAGCLNSTFDMSTAAVQRIENSVTKPPDAASMVFSVAGTAISCIPGGKAAIESWQCLNAAKELAEVGATQAKMLVFAADKYVATNSAVKNIVSDGVCGPKALTDWEKQDWVTRAGFDPNYLSGSSSYDTVRHFTNNYSSQKYEIGFENKPAATAEAQHVMIVDSLNRDKFDLSTFRLMGFSIADSMYVLPPFRDTYTGDFGLSYRSDMKIRLTANLDTATGVLHTDFFSIRNNGQVFPPDSLGGFFPPDVDGVRGTGSIRYEISAKAARTLDTFSNKALIYFDANVPIATNTWMNTVDTTAPKSSVIRALPVNDSTVKLMIQSDDEGSGIKYTEIFMKTVGDSLFHDIGLTTTDSLLVPVDPHKTYQFFSVAVDHVNYQEKKDSAAEITYSATPLPVHLLSFTGVKEGARAKLLWTGANEQNFSRYEVQRSSDGISFDKIGVVTAKGGGGNNNYTLYDEQPFPKANYYRLKEIDLDGAFVYSRVIQLDFDKPFTIALSPVPAHDQIIIDGIENFKRVQLLDMSGRVVREFTRINGNTFSVQGLVNGVYLVRLISDKGNQTLKMIKN